MKEKRVAGLQLPRPKRLHHIVEDFLTDWTGPITHLLPLRRFLETVTSQDLRHFFSPHCLEISLTHLHSPMSCQLAALSPPSLLLQRFLQLQKETTFF